MNIREAYYSELLNAYNIECQIKAKPNCLPQAPIPKEPKGTKLEQVYTHRQLPHHNYLKTPYLTQKKIASNK